MHGGLFFQEKRLLCFAILMLLVVFLLFFNTRLAEASYHQTYVLFVSDLVEAGNMDIYALDVDSPATPAIRLTTDPAIDNHAKFSPDGSKIVWSSERDPGPGANPEGDFELFIKTGITSLSTGLLELTPLQLTANLGILDDRHPHFSDDGEKIIYDVKDNPVGEWCMWESSPSVDAPFSNCLGAADSGGCFTDQCSQPVPCCEDPQSCCPPGGGVCEGKQDRLYEQLHIINADGTNNITINPASADDVTADYWPNNEPSTPWDDSMTTAVGHPSISSDGDRILFSAAVDGQGDDWEMYQMDWDGAGGVSNLRRVTYGSDFISPNPILMTAGGHYTDVNTIIFTSTRLEGGNSQLFEVDWNAENAVVGSPEVTQLTTHGANDYVPQQMEDGSDRIVVVSDRGVSTALCDTPGALNPTDDLDLIIMESDGTGQINLTDNDTNDEILLIGDEVSWFCGIKPMLAECTYYPKIMKVSTARTLRDWSDDPGQIPPYFPNRDIYPLYWGQLTTVMLDKYPDLWDQLTDPTTGWLDDPNMQDRRVMVPTIMNEIVNNPPTEPTGPYPPNGGTEVPLSPTLSWTGSTDPDLDPLTYDVYFGTHNPPRSIRTPNGLTTSARVEDLEPGTTYYWKIVVEDSRGGMADPVWSFTTAGAPGGPMTGLNFAGIALAVLAMTISGTFLLRRSRIKRQTLA